MKRVIIVHKWDGSPDGDWYPWLKQELENFQVDVPAMPNPSEPKIETWIPFLQERVTPDNDTYFVGHSIGCQAILRYLASLPKKTVVGGVVLVAGFVRLSPLETNEEEEIARPWLTPLPWDTIASHISQTVAIFSDNDPYVPVDNAQIFKEKLKAKIIIEKQKGHFTREDGVLKLPSVLETILEISR